VNLIVFILAVCFGFALSRSGASDYDFIQKMFLLEDIQLYGIIGSAVAVTAPGLWLLKRYGKNARGEPLQINRKHENRGNIVGGALFGIGWALTGMCPGPILVNIGEGKLYAWAAFVGVLAGTYLTGALYRRFSNWWGMPPLPAPPS